MNDEPLSEGIVAAHDRLVAEAVDAERERAAEIVRRRLRQLGYSEGRWFAVLNEILAPKPKPEPPAAEPMTVERLVARLDSDVYDQDVNDCGSICNLAADLAELVREQVRRDAEWLRTYGDGYDYLGRKLLKSAGLE